MTDVSPNSSSSDDIVIDSNQELLSKVIKILLINITCYALSYLLNMVIAKYTTTTQYGKYNLIINSIVSLAGFMMFGLDVGSEYFVSLYAETKKWPKLRGFFVFIIKFFSYAGMPFILLSMLFYGMHIFHGDFARLDHVFTTIEQSHPILLYAWVVPFFAVMLVISAVLCSLDGQVSSQIVSGVLSPCIQLVIIFFCFFVLGRVHVYYAVYAFGISAACVIVVESILIKKRLPADIWQPQIENDRKVWMTYAFPAFLFNIICLGIDTTVLWLLNVFHDKSSYLGYYSAVTAISGYFINITVFSIVALFDIYIAPLWAEKNYVRLQQLVNKSFYVLTASSIFFCLYVIIFGKKLLANFGLSYVQAYPALIIYTVSSCLNTATLMWESLLNYTDQPYKLVKSYAFAYLVLIIGIVLASKWQMDFSKVMIAYALFQLVFFFGNAFYIWKKLRPIQLFPGFAIPAAQV